MNVTIISRDNELYRLCRDILADVTKQNWDLSVAEPEEAPRNADLYLWDIQPSTIPAGFRAGSATHLCLLSRKDRRCRRN